MNLREELCDIFGLEELPGELAGLLEDAEELSGRHPTVVAAAIAAMAAGARPKKREQPPEAVPVKRPVLLVEDMDLDSDVKEALLAASVITAADVLAHPNLTEILQVGPKTRDKLLELASV